MALTHMAGVAVQIGDRVIQRCAICGEKLIDAHPSLHDFLEKTGLIDIKLATWDTGALITIKDKTQVRVNTPDNLCIVLVEA